MAQDSTGDDQSEALDSDKVGDEYPPDEPVASEDYGITGAEQRHDEPLEERVRREEPDRPEAGETGEDARVVQPVAPDVPGEELEPSAAEIEAVEDPDVRDRPPDDQLTGDETTRDTVNERVSPPAEETALHVDEDS
jgi:hypothetical protein